MFFSSSDPPLLSHACQLPQRTLWFGRARLYEDRVCIQGWTWSGGYRKIIPLERIDRVQWLAVIDDVNFVLHLENGRAVPFQLLQGAGTWNVKLHGLLDQRLPAHQSLPDVPQSEQVFL